jgi:hypothetical protein
MAYEQKPGDIAVFKEKEKRNDRAPDWRGNMIVPEGAKPGDKLEVAFWIKGDSGTMLAGSVKFPNQRDAGPGGQHGQGQDAGRKAAYEASLRGPDFDSPF